MKVSKGLGGRGTAIAIERKEHPDGHFEAHRAEVEKAGDGSFIIKKYKRLKASHENAANYYGGYREPETATAPDHAGMMAALASHFGAPKAKK